jgi:molecular chaperone GrpE
MDKKEQQAQGGEEQQAAGKMAEESRETGQVTGAPHSAGQAAGETQAAAQGTGEARADGQETKEQAPEDQASQEHPEHEPKTRKAGRSAAEKAREEISRLDNALKELQDKYLRLSAEFDNYRKRMLKEKMDWNRYAGEEIFSRMLPVIDDFERALVHIREAADMEALKQGIELIYNKFRDYLNQQGVSEINAMNQDFDMDQHEAVTKIPAPEPALKGKIVDVIEKGYTLNEKVIRFPKVVIGE